ncbi:MAG: hypothetical protein MI755_19060, partial [Sphingomonadales bacterium]|nr:hypothetical protein [Sphingomonadales bacterium]
EGFGIMDLRLDLRGEAPDECFLRQVFDIRGIAEMSRENASDYLLVRPKRLKNTGHAASTFFDQNWTR